MRENKAVKIILNYQFSITHMNIKIAYLPGDGVGPEVAGAAKQALEAVGKKYGHTFIFEKALIGAVAIDQAGDPYPLETAKLCEASDAILFGAIGDPKYDNDPSAKVRPEQGLLKMRKDLGLYANVRPIKIFQGLEDQSPLKREIVDGVDMVVVRELIGGAYFGKKGTSEDGSYAYDTIEYTREGIERIVEYAIKLAGKRKKKLTLVDKANVLETSRLWRRTFQEKVSTLEAHSSKLQADFMFVDNASMQLIKRPSSFDVIVTENMFGDILTDEASVIAGSLGMLPSASIGEKTAVYEPIHGSYPKAAGQNTANPIGSIMSVAMMMEYSFDLSEEARAIEEAVQKTIDARGGTKDLFPDNPSSTTAVARSVVENLNLK